MKENYIEVIMLIGRLNRSFMDIIKLHLDRMMIKDINNIQCFILYNIGEHQLTVGEISNRGYYLGSNVTYNLKKMLDNGYLIQDQSLHDRRSSHIKLSPKGEKLFKALDHHLEKQAEKIKKELITEQEFKIFTQTLHKLEYFWSLKIAQELS